MMQNSRILTLLLIICVIICITSSKTIDGRKVAHRLLKDEFVTNEDTLPSLPLVTRAKSSIPTHPQPRPSKRLPSEEDDKIASQAPGSRRLAISSRPIANNGGNGIGNGHGGRHPRAVPTPVTTKAGTRPTTTESSENNDDITTQQRTSEDDFTRRSQRGDGSNNRPPPRHPRHPRPDQDRPSPPQVPLGTRPNNSPRPTKDSSSSEDDIFTTTSETIGDDEFGRNIGNVVNDDSQILEHP